MERNKERVREGKNLTNRERENKEKEWIKRVKQENNTKGKRKQKTSEK